MLYLKSYTEDEATVHDTDDNTDETISISRLEDIVFNKGIKVNGVLHNYDGTLYLNSEYSACNKKFSDDYFRLLVWNLVGDDYSFIEPYISMRSPMRIKHNVCGHEYSVTPTKFFSGNRCTNCSSKTYWNIDSLREKVKELGLEVLSDKYYSNRTKLKFRHIICGQEFIAEPRAILNNNLICPFCSRLGNRSFPEYILFTHISKYIECIASYRPDWLILNSGYIGELDIFIPSKNIGIEFDGEFHKDSNLVVKDRYKDLVVSQNNVSLYRIRVAALRDIPLYNSVCFVCENTFNLKTGYNIEAFTNAVNLLCDELDIPHLYLDENNINTMLINYREEISNYER